MTVNFNLSTQIDDFYQNKNIHFIRTQQQYLHHHRVIKNKEIGTS